MSLIRRLGGYLSRGVVLRRRFAESVGGGILYVTPEASLRYWRPGLDHVDPSLLSLATELIGVGDVVWDVGANVGYFSFAAAGVSGVTGRVLSIEPDYWLVGLLHRSANANGDRIAKVDVLPVAVSDNQGIKRFHIAARGRAANYLEGSNLTEVRVSKESVLVPTVTLDWLLEHCSAPSVLKIDVEGAEAQVLQGAARLLNTVRPAILCEVGSENSAQVSECLSANGYLLFDAGCPKAQREPLRRAPWNTLAIPEDRWTLSGIESENLK